MSGERGAGTALALAVIGAVVALFVVLAAAGVVLETHRRVVSVADAAALAGADTALGYATGLPCDRAAGIATAAALRLDRCEQRGPLVRVRVSASTLGLALRATAVAGPPPAPGRGAAGRSAAGLRVSAPCVWCAGPAPGCAPGGPVAAGADEPRRWPCPETRSW